MTKPLLLFALAAPLALNAATDAEIAAMLRTRYERDMSNETGRVWWHGTRKSHVADPSNEVEICTYADGSTFRIPARVTTPADAARRANAKLPRTVDTNGVPAKLAAARLRRAAERAAVSNVTRTVTTAVNATRGTRPTEGN